MCISPFLGLSSLAEKVTARLLLSPTPMVSGDHVYITTDSVGTADNPNQNPGQQPQATSPLGCHHPETRSSEISSTGHAVYASDNKVMSAGVNPGSGFGCQ
mgnify:CR=1 FL=1